MTTTAPAARVGPALDGELARARAEVREELGRANTTALGALAAATTLAGVGLAALLAGDWAPADLPAAGQIVWWTAVMTAAAGLALLGGAVLPDVTPDGPGQPPPVSWASIATYPADGIALAGALATLATDPAPLAAHLRFMAGIARTKWRRIRYGLLALACGGVLLAALALVTAAA